MKALPCGRCRAPALTRSGVVFAIGGLSVPVYTYICRRCGRPNQITSEAFARLPSMTAVEIASASCDMPWSNDAQVPMEAMQPQGTGKAEDSRVAQPLKKPRSKLKPRPSSKPSPKPPS